MKPSDELTDKEIEARREAGLKKLLATPHKPHKPHEKDAGPKPGASQSVKDDRKELGGGANHGGKAEKAGR